MLAKVSILLVQRRPCDFLPGMPSESKIGHS